MTNKLVSINQVVVNYNCNNKGEKCVGIENINLEIQSGEFVSIVGPSGCGKSTILRLMAGLTKTNSGNITYREKELTDVNDNAKIVFQNYALLPWLNVYENVTLGISDKNIDPTTLSILVHDAIADVGLKDFMTAYPTELSGGMCQRVGFARALIAKPELLLLDEPFSALDAITSRHLRHELNEKWRNKSLDTKAIVMVTHDVAEAIEMSDRIIVMSGQPGKIVHEIAPLDNSSIYKEQLENKIYKAMQSNSHLSNLAA